MAPTEILAEQHYNSFVKFCKPAGIHIEILTGNLKKTEKEKFEISVGAILTQNTSWKNVETTLNKLRENNTLNKETIKEHGSQGEKKLLKYLLKLTEAKIIEKTNEEKPIILLDDFFAKLDNENIMKIFSYFHRKFQTIITTTNTNHQTLEKIQKQDKKINILFIND